MFFRAAIKNYEIHLKWWSQLFFGDAFFVKKPFDRRNPNAESYSHAEIDRIAGIYPLWDQFLESLNAHALNTSSPYYARSQDFKKQLRDFFQLGDGVPNMADIIQNKQLLDEYVRNRTEENKQKFIVAIKRSVALRLDIPRATSLKIISEDQFFNEYMNSVVGPLHKDKERLAAADPKDPRIKVLDKTINEIKAAAVTCAQRYESELRRRRISYAFDYQTKNFYKSCVVKIINDNLIEKESLGAHKHWGTNYGKGLLNVVACIPVIGQMVGCLHYLATGRYFWQTTTDAQYTANSAHVRARDIRISPTLRSR